jgi:hypothetical protein
MNVPPAKDFPPPRDTRSTATGAESLPEQRSCDECSEGLRVVATRLRQLTSQVSNLAARVERIEISPCQGSQGAAPADPGP